MYFTWQRKNRYTIGHIRLPHFSEDRNLYERIKVWSSKTSDLKTFSNFKVHMRTEYSDLQDVGGLTIQNTMPNQANMIQELKDHQVLM
mgnify:CR=1 FL=1